jgi:TonB family protein
MYRLSPQLHLVRIIVLVASNMFFASEFIVGPQDLLAQISQNLNNEIKAPRNNPIMIGGNVSDDPRRHIVYPVYPEKAKRERIEGNVRLTLTINEGGLVYDVRGIPGNDPILEESAIAAVKQWRFRPFLLMGEPIPVLKRKTISFVWKDREDLHVWLDDSGLSCDITQILAAKGEVWIEAHAAYQLIENLYRELTQKGVQRVHWPGYQIFQNRLFCLMDMMGKGGPNFDISDIDRVNQEALASGKFGYLDIRLSYMLYFDRSHTFVGLQRLEGPEIREVEMALSQLHATKHFPFDSPAAISFYLPIDLPIVRIRNR